MVHRLSCDGAIQAELFQRGVGDTTDVVQKEMYTFDDREEGRSISLRPEGTASVARSVIENGLYGGTMPLRLYYIINCFRHEKPQAGRYREFYQFGVELFGATSAAADAQIIALGAAFLRRLGLPFILRLNSIGCKKCLKVGCPALMMQGKKSHIDPTLCVGCTVCAQVCPVGAISRKEN